MGKIQFSNDPRVLRTNEIIFEIWDLMII
jgi:hypothetical protein